MTAGLGRLRSAQPAVLPGNGDGERIAQEEIASHGSGPEGAPSLIRGHEMQEHKGQISENRILLGHRGEHQR